MDRSHELVESEEIPDVFIEQLGKHLGGCLADYMQHLLNFVDVQGQTHDVRSDARVHEKLQDGPFIL